MAKTFKITKKTWKTIGAVALSVLVGVGAIFGVAKLSEALDTETKTIHPTYSVGGLKTTDGKYTETTDSIYTKDAFECQGLKITPDFDSNVSYEVFFYDSNEQFLSTSGSKTDFYESNNKLAKYARIQITPLEDDKVSWFETSKYANQLKVEVNKDQTIDIEKTLSGLENKAVILGAGLGGFNGQEFEFTPSEALTVFIQPLEVSSTNSILLKVENSHLNTKCDSYHNCVELFNPENIAFDLANNVIAQTREFSYILINVRNYDKVSCWICPSLVDSFAIYML